MDKLSTKDLTISEIPSDARSRGIELSIIIVDYKSQKYSLPLVVDLQKRLKHLKFEIIIVDNNPSGDADKTFKKEFKGQDNIHVIKAKENKGYGSGNNLGVKNASGEYLLLLNPDTGICDDAIEQMLDFLARHSEVGALTCLLMQADGENLQRDFFGNFQSLAGVTIKRWNKKNAQVDKSGEFFYVDMISGAAMMLRRDTYQKIGGFDENFFMYIEDDDLCRRITGLGCKNAVITTAKIIHFEGQSSNNFEKKKFYYKSQDYYWQKHYGSFKTTLMKIIRSPYVLVQKVRSARQN
ncbi:MAG: glycosyltransferase family 2 protein [Candidatus Berkelbacteria bacterium]